MKAAVNLLSGKHKERAERYVAVRMAAAAAIFIFLLWALVAFASSVTLAALRAEIYRNAELLDDPRAAEAEQLHRLAAELQKRNENAERHFAGDNMNLGLLDAIAAAVDKPLSEIEYAEGIIFVTGSVPDENSFEVFVERLRAQGCFSEISVSGFERSNNGLSFILELRPGINL